MPAVGRLWPSDDNENDCDNVDRDENHRDHHHHYYNEGDDIEGSSVGDEDSMVDSDDDGSQPPLPRLRQVLQPVSRAALPL